MKQMNELRPLFTPYELAAGGMMLSCAFAVSGFVFALIFGWGLSALLALAIGGIVGIATRYGVACPRCGKSPLKRYLLDRDTLGGLLYVRRIWPERECSSCRTPLNIL